MAHTQSICHFFQRYMLLEICLTLCEYYRPYYTRLYYFVVYMYLSTKLIHNDTFASSDPTFIRTYKPNQNRHYLDFKCNMEILKRRSHLRLNNINHLITEFLISYQENHREMKLLYKVSCWEK